MPLMHNVHNFILNPNRQPHSPFHAAEHYLFSLNTIIPLHSVAKSTFPNLRLRNAMPEVCVIPSKITRLVNPGVGFIEFSHWTLNPLELLREVDAGQVGAAPKKKFEIL